LAAVDLTFNKTVTDEYDLLGCCCYFGVHGGLTGAVRALSKHEVPAYYGDTRDRDRVEVRTLAEEVRRVVRAKLLNPKWIEGMKRHGYKGAGDISRQVGTVYGWEATTQEVDDRIFDDIARTFVLDPEMRQFFADENPWALEEIGRRLL
ncbi:cobaltochelatase subunit CobN, partial [Methanoculleus sp. UBA340]